MKTEAHQVGKYLLFFPLLFTLLSGAAFGGVGPLPQGGAPKGCPPGSMQYGNCICGQSLDGRIICYEE